MHAYWVSLTDGTDRRRTKILALDYVFAWMEAQRLFKDTVWRIVNVSKVS